MKTTTIGCPACGRHDSEVKDSRSTIRYIRRRRVCRRCAHRWTTIEINAMGADLLGHDLPAFVLVEPDDLAALEHAVNVLGSIIGTADQETEANEEAVS